ncbi:MAG: hypothetical protein KKD77_21745 [Gammaproteobacteria bacterium]|uniref:Uncharacterized protein n=1 Tax=viral metagenome TaxID=1070528 RepID=A0A6M3LD73_9ZZZZ|nr:hypothetical protein [Gammaproteobacteria bacterium]
MKSLIGNLILFCVAAVLVAGMIMLNQAWATSNSLQQQFDGCQEQLDGCQEVKAAQVEDVLQCQTEVTELRGQTCATELQLQEQYYRGLFDVCRFVGHMSVVQCNAFVHTAYNHAHPPYDTPSEDFIWPPVAPDPAREQETY